MSNAYMIVIYFLVMGRKKKAGIETTDMLITFHKQSAFDGNKYSIVPTCEYRSTSSGATDQGRNTT
jgi:hypothetical protein